MGGLYDTICNQCGKEFSHRNHRKFCSRDCYLDHRFPMRRMGNKVLITCVRCGDKALQNCSVVRRAEKLRGYHFCSKLCAVKKQHEQKESRI